MQSSEFAVFVLIIREKSSPAVDPILANFENRRVDEARERRNEGYSGENDAASCVLST
jgi:hypothetical protein